MDARWTIELLGGLRAHRAGRVLTRFRTQKTAVLLAFLALHPDRRHSRESLIELLWPNATPQTGRNQLSMALSFLRHPLEPPGTSPGAVLIADRYSVQFNPEAFTTDVADFEAALRRATLGGAHWERAEALEAATALYTGEFMPGYFDDWILEERTRLAERCLQALEQLTATSEQAGELERALRTAHRALGMDPLKETNCQIIMRLYAASGQPASALRAYREWQEHLARETGEQPSPAIVEWVARLQAELTQAPLREEEEPTPSEIGSRRASRRSVGASSAAPTGTVALLLTQIERPSGEQAISRATLALHHLLLRGQFQRHGGYEVRDAADGFVIAFSHVGEALDCAVACQRALSEQPWPPPQGAPRVRMALHVGAVEAETGDYEGLTLARAARLLSAGHGGQILCSEAAAVLLRHDPEAAVWLHELGLYRPGESMTPERLYQANIEGLTSEFAAPRAECAYPSTLPLQGRRFIGRAREIDRLCRLLLPDAKPASALLSPSPRLVTLTGPGGVGKTRLALEAGRQLVEPLSGAVFFVPLSEVTESVRIAEALVEALKLARSPGREPLDLVVEFVGRQPSLLVLDNFEQLLRAPEVEASVELIAALLQRAPGLKLLVTSRQRLGLSGEWEVGVAPLQLAPQEQAPAMVGDSDVRRSPGGTVGVALAPQQLADVESIALFVDRAQWARPDFQLTARNATAVAELCARLEGLPLAIELAAARAQVLTPAQMLGQMSRRFQFLVGRSRGAEVRHRTLQSAIEWSFRLLSPALRRFFARLSVFRGGWSLEAAEAVCEEELTLDAFSQLQECSLIVAEETRETMRYGMLETLREYAIAQMAAEEWSALRRRHRDHYLAWAEEICPRLTEPEAGEWLDRLEAEHDNLRAALELCRKERRGSEAGIRLGLALHRFWVTRGHARESKEFLADLLTGVEDLRELRLKARSYRELRLMLLTAGECDRAREYGEKALTLCLELGEEGWAADALSGLGYLATLQGDYGRSLALQRESLSIRQRLGDKRGMNQCLINLGYVSSRAGDYEGAAGYFRQGLAVAREIEDPTLISGILVQQSHLHRLRGDLKGAREICEEALALVRPLGALPLIVAAINQISHIAYLQGELAVARKYGEESLAVAQRIDDKSAVFRACFILGQIDEAEGDYARARSFYEQGLAITQSLGEKYSISVSLILVARFSRRLKDYAACAGYLASCLTLCRETGSVAPTTDALQVLGELGLDLNRLQQAALLLGSAAFQREAQQPALMPEDPTAWEAMLARLRADLGAEAFSRQWERGRSLTLDQAIQIAEEMDVSRQSVDQ